MIQVLFVCLGNICRSPTAQGVFEHLVNEHSLSHAIGVDSAGTGDWHIGEPPDVRSQAAAARRGIDISRQRARQVTARDCERFDYILAMESDNLRALQHLCPPEHRHKLRLFMDYAPQLGLRDVPDPYYGGPEAFEHVLDLVSAAAIGLLAEIRTQALTPDSDQ